MLTPVLDHAWIAAHIPHQGRMCLLDRVVSWDDSTITCRAGSHRDTSNPLRADAQLGAACGIEYAAQAMAVHGVLSVAPGTPRPRAGYLVSVRSVKLSVARLDDIAGELDVSAACVTRSGSSVLYAFAVRGGAQLLLEGRAAVVLDTESLTERRTP